MFFAKDYITPNGVATAYQGICALKLSLATMQCEVTLGHYEKQAFPCPAPVWKTTYHGVPITDPVKVYEDALAYIQALPEWSVQQQ